MFFFQELGLWRRHVGKLLGRPHGEDTDQQTDKAQQDRAAIQCPNRLWTLTARLLKPCLPDGSRHPGMPEYKDAGLLKLAWTSSWKGTSATVPMGSMRAPTAGRT